jgi:hypothetical protein
VCFKLPTKTSHHTSIIPTKMRFSQIIACVFVAGSFTTALAVPIKTQEVDCMSSSLPTKTSTSDPTLVPRQDWNWPTHESIPAWTPIPEPILVYTPAQPSAIIPSVSYTAVPSATTTPQPHNNETKEPKKLEFGSISTLMVFTCIGIVLLVVFIWAVVAHSKGQRPFACLGGCRGRKKNVETAQRGSTTLNIPLTGAGRHYERRPVSMQPQPLPMPSPQRPKPVQQQIPRRPLSEPEWAKDF